MWTVVMVPQLMIYDTMIRMVRLQQVLQPSASLLGFCFDIVDFDRGNVNARIVAATSRAKEWYLESRQLKHGALSGTLRKWRELLRGCKRKL